jgi:hypothetical protein
VAAFAGIEEVIEESWACGQPKGDAKRFGPATTLYGTVALSFVIPSVPGFPTSPLSPATTHVVLSKENHTHLTKAATLDRNPGEPRDLQFSGPFVEMFSFALHRNL